MKNDIVVSVCCITYNQEKYIRRAIESFLMQETNFNYEIIIHDDASTDNTTNIVKEYQKKYPNIIKPIYEDKNQYSIDQQSVLVKTFNTVKGDYVALCEGDDYWTSKDKLQLQYDYMCKHNTCTLCIHGTEAIYENEKKDTFVIKPFNENKDFDIEFYLTKEPFFHTSSFFFPSKLAKKLPDYYLNAKIGDFPLKLYLISNGYCHYMDKFMSTYTYFSIGSWSARSKKNTYEQKVTYKEMVKRIYYQFDKTTNYKYSEIVKDCLQKYEFRFLVQTGNLKEIKKEVYKNLYKELSFKIKMKLFIKNIPLIKKIYTMIKKWRCK